MLGGVVRRDYAMAYYIPTVSVRTLLQPHDTHPVLVGCEVLKGFSCFMSDGVLGATLGWGDSRQINSIWTEIYYITRSASSLSGLEKRSPSSSCISIPLSASKNLRSAPRLGLSLASLMLQASRPSWLKCAQAFCVVSVNLRRPFTSTGTSAGCVKISVVVAFQRRSDQTAAITITEVVVVT